MRQFDLVENPSETTHAVAPYFLVLQSHLLDRADTAIVAPVVRDAGRPFTRIDLPVVVQGEALTVTLAELFSIDRAWLSTVRGSLADREDEIRRALDRLFTGF